MATATTPQREWIASEFSKGIDAEQHLVAQARARADSPPDPAFQVLYSEIAAADERHRVMLETIATRYGRTPSRAVASGVGESLGRLIKDKLGNLGASPMQLLGDDLVAKANAIHWYLAWIEAFSALGDAESARELSAVLTEETAHRDALQKCLNQLVTRGATCSESAAD
ncbi:MAG: hypothetical protein U0794_13645 [Isosphaeraceae bacterium]